MSIVIEKLTHIYMPGTPFETTALRSVSLTVEDGSFVGVIGHTGSGKSTLVQHMNGLLRPTSGRVVVEGIDVGAKGADLRALRQQVGLVFQYPEYQLFEETVSRDVAFGPRNLGLSEAEVARRVEEALSRVGIDPGELGARSPFELSGGQRRRVALAGVLAMEPRVLILDEPTAGLDPEGRSDMLRMMRELRAREGTTILMISHNMDEVAQVADRVLVMAHGEAILYDTPANVFADARRLSGLGLDVPLMARLSDALRRRGVTVPRGLLTLDAMEAFILERTGRGGRDAG
ncbi:MAG: energy-coupling factor transporter ATPase [Clostridiales bacterium]|nr:energy-coupling factor transporter ATPase [Clostridiales bacterium]